MQTIETASNPIVLSRALSSVDNGSTKAWLRYLGSPFHTVSAHHYVRAHFWSCSAPRVPADDIQALVAK
jgi:hypothetical protein